MAQEPRFVLHYFPLAVFIVFPLTFAASYSIAVRNDHILPFFAYISDTGTFAPEMCWFGLGLSMAMVLVGITAYIRYCQVREFLLTRHHSPTPCLHRWNTVGLVFGLLAAFGTCVVGAFQEVSVLSIHILGAMFAFGGGSIFLIIQGCFTKVMAPHFGSAALAYIRVFFGVSCFLLFATSLSTGAQSFKYFTGDKSVRWEPHHGGWTLRVTSTVTEWVMAAMFDLYFLSFVPEFRKIAFYAPQFKFIEVSSSSGRKQVHHAVNNNVTVI